MDPATIVEAVTDGTRLWLRYGPVTGKDNAATPPRRYGTGGTSKRLVEEGTISPNIVMRARILLHAGYSQGRPGVRNVDSARSLG